MMQQKSRNKIRLINMLLSIFTCGLVVEIVERQAQQVHVMQPAAVQPSDISVWFGVFELPFLFLAVFFGFRTASALKGGLFGRGMGLMAWGFLVMAIGHLHMQVEHFFHYNLFAELFGQRCGAVMWFAALVVTWALSGLGFYKIYKASRAG